jgi:hypothetical protein
MLEATLLLLEEYISKRKKEDRINELDIKSIGDNTRICVNYVFEYFNNYLTIDKMEEKTVRKSEQVEKLRNQLQDYSPDVIDWIVEIFEEHNRHMHRLIGNSIEDELFLLYTKDDEFRSLSYECYARLIKRCSFLKDQTEKLFDFLKDYHRIKSKIYNMPYICDEINEWLNHTMEKYKVNMSEFASNYASKFYDDENKWPVSHRTKSEYDFKKYDYNYKQKHNLFNIDSLYRKMPKKSFIKGRKQEIEVLIMYYWLHEIVGDDENFWDGYLNSIIPYLQENNI